MSNYTKFTLATFKARLTGGIYANIVGANRAIGKTQELSDEDKSKARVMAAKHFGVAAPTKKAAPKPAAKAVTKPEKKATKATKKVAKKATKKAAKKKATKKASKAATTAEPAPGASPKAVAVAVSKAPTSIAPTQEQTDERRARVISQIGSVITTIGQALTSMKDAKQLFPKAELEEGVTSAVDSMSRAVQRLDQEIISPDLPPAKKLKVEPTAEAGGAEVPDTVSDTAKVMPISGGKQKQRPAQAVAQTV